MMRRILKALGLVFGALVVLVFCAALALWGLGNTARGRALIVGLVERLSDHRVHLVGLGGAFPAHLTLERLSLTDTEGVWLGADHIVLDWSPFELLDRRVAIDRLSVAMLAIDRAPVSQGPPGPAPSIPHIEIAAFSLGELRLGAPLVGTPVALTVHGSARLRSLENASAELVAQRMGGVGDYRLHVSFDPTHMEASLDAHEPASGPLEHLLELPGLGALSAQVRLAGPRTAQQLDATVTAGSLSLKVSGQLDLERAATDLEHASADLDLTLESPALSPRPDLAWQRLALSGHWRGSLARPSAQGHLEVAGLRVGDATLEAARAQLETQGRTLGLHGEIDGLQIPGPDPRLLAAEPLGIEAELALGEKDWPLEANLTHRLFALRLHTHARGPTAAEFGVHLPDLAPLGKIAGEALAGEAELNGRLEQRTSEALGLTLKGTASRLKAGGSWAAWLDDRLAVDLSAVLSSRTLELERLELSAPTLSASVAGSITRPTAAPAGRPPEGLARFLEATRLRFKLDLQGLERLSPNVAGTLHAEGRIEGPVRDLTATTELQSHLSIRGSSPGLLTATLIARGLPRPKSGELKAHGSIDEAPFEIDAALEPAADGWHAIVRRADWKSAHVHGELAINRRADAADRGDMQLTVGDLSDFDRIAGAQLTGHIEARLGFTPLAGHPQGHLELVGQGIGAAGVAGDLRVSGHGPASGLALDVAASAPTLGGYPAALNATAVLDLEKDAVRITGASAQYRKVDMRLLAPAEVHFGHKLAFDSVQLGAGHARLALHGEVTPTLDVEASLEQVDRQIVNLFVPQLLGAGTIGGHLHLTGALHAPAGEVRLDATGLRLAGEDAVGLPAIDVRAKADLDGTSAHLDAHVMARGASVFAVTGALPLEESGSYSLKAQGKIDMGLVNALLEARGMQASGQLGIDGALAGTRSAPKIHGTIALSEGSLRDYAHGMSLTQINAQVSGNEDKLAIEHFTARAASGTVTVTGDLSPLAPGVPISLAVTAKNAQPIASNLLTMTVESRIKIEGKLFEQVDIGGTIHVDRAVIGIPESLPPDVAVLDVRRRDHATSAEPSERRLLYAFDVTVDAPNQVLVQGRGLDAELGGRLHIGGTSEAIKVTGGFDLERGSFSVGGSRLILQQPGKVSFDDAGLRNKIDPTLDFTASSTVADVGTSVTATLKITGTASAPKFDFSSVPERPPDEIMALLLFGQPPGQLSALQLAQIGAALATLTGIGGGGPNPLTKLQKTLGLDRLSVGSNTTTTATGATESSGAAISAGRYLTRNVYVEARQTTTGDSQVEVDVNLTRHLRLQTRLGNGTATVQGATPENDPGSSIGLSYQIDY